jgi:hypothetical protein
VIPSLRPFRLPRFATLVLVVGMVVAQWMYLQHQSDLGQHKAGHVCEGCLAYGQLGDAAATAAVPPPVVHVHVLATGTRLIPATRTLRFSYGARAPPFPFHS